jgi:hypothetical protein
LLTRVSSQQWPARQDSSKPGDQGLHDPLASADKQAAGIWEQDVSCLHRKAGSSSGGRVGCSCFSQRAGLPAPAAEGSRVGGRSCRSGVKQAGRRARCSCSTWWQHVLDVQRLDTCHSNTGALVDSCHNTATGSWGVVVVEVITIKDLVGAAA